jgi:hypothetical protein
MWRYNKVIIFCYFLGFSGTESTIAEATTGLLYQPRMMDDNECGTVGWMSGRGNSKYSEITCLSAALFTTNPTLPDPGSNPGRRGEKQTTNRLSYGAAVQQR